jgi:hypothetical protein
VTAPEPDAGALGDELADDLDELLGPEGDLETFEDPDLNDCNEWEFLP